jgi:hypothetical protein
MSCGELAHVSSSGAGNVEDVLAGGARGAEGVGLGGGCGLVVLVALLDQKSDAAVGTGHDANSLLSHSQCHELVCAFLRVLDMQCFSCVRRGGVDSW